MLFTGDVQCVFCGSKIKFLGNIIIYQSQQCSNHNQEHQFPGMNIVVDGAHKTNTCGIHLPGTNQRKSSAHTYKHPIILRSRKVVSKPPEPAQFNGVIDNTVYAYAQNHNTSREKPNLEDEGSGENKSIFVCRNMIARNIIDKTQSRNTYDRKLTFDFENEYHSRIKQTDNLIGIYQKLL